MLWRLPAAHLNIWLLSPSNLPSSVRNPALLLVPVCAQQQPKPRHSPRSRLPRLPAQLGHRDARPGHSPPLPAQEPTLLSEATDTTPGSRTQLSTPPTLQQVCPAAVFQQIDSWSRVWKCRDDSDPRCSEVSAAPCICKGSSAGEAVPPRTALTHPSSHPSAEGHPSTQFKQGT